MSSGNGNGDSNSLTKKTLEGLEARTDVSIKNVFNVVLMACKGLNGLKDDVNELKVYINVLKGKVDGIAHAIGPLSNPLILAAPVITSGSTTKKNGVFTWFSFPREAGADAVAAIGSAHTALRYITTWVDHARPRDDDGMHHYFITLPDSVLRAGNIRAIHFIDVEKMKNPLPATHDICLVEFANSLALPISSECPTYCPVNHPKSSPVSSISLNSSNVVGKSIGGFVTSKGGAVTINMNGDLGHIDFLLDVGEPRDSGTLLYVQNETNHHHHPIAIFSGLSGSAGHKQKRGRACVIPPLSAFKTRLSTVNWPEVGQVRQAVLVCRRGSSKFKVDVMQNSNLVCLTELQNGRRTSTQIRGVFVKSEKPISYMGDADIAAMNGTGDAVQTPRGFWGP